MKYAESFQGSELSFWEVFPYMKEVGLFRKLYLSDRSESKNKSSKVMWYLTMVKDIDSEFYSLEKGEQDEMLFDTLNLNILKFVGGQEELDLLLNAFENFIDTPLSADVRALENKMKDRKKFIQETNYTLDAYEEGMDGKVRLVKGTASQLDKMVTDTKKLHEEIRSLRAALKSAQSEQGKGGRKDSLLDG